MNVLHEIRDAEVCYHTSVARQNSNLRQHLTQICPRISAFWTTELCFGKFKNAG